jgi:hypothetical protein
MSFKTENKEREDRREKKLKREGDWLLYMKGRRKQSCKVTNVANKI